MYKCKHFKIYELVSEDIYKKRGEKAWYLFDSRALEMLDKVREFSGSLTVNNWYWKGNREWSGLRTPESPYYSPYSQHTYGRAFDCIAREKTAQELREHILSNPEEFPYIRGIELGVSWLHFDTGNRPGEDIYTFNP
jgi:hypothetical protein